MPIFGRKRRDPPPPAAPDPALVAVGYHDRTKHHPQRHARALGYLDWDTQPDPFRRFDGAPLMPLAMPPVPDAPYAALYRPGAVTPRALDREALSSFLFHALALSAWKSIPGARWSLRVDPSSGNLHPTEGWLLLPATSGLHDAPALWHYAPKEHGLERRAVLDAAAYHAALRGALAARAAAPGDATANAAGTSGGAETARAAADASGAARAHTAGGGFLVALSSIPWRESWKYGERAYRYCQHDVGHALGALTLSATLHGWRLSRLTGVSDATLAALLGLERPDAGHEGEREVPDLLALVTPTSTSTSTPTPTSAPAGDSRGTHPSGDTRSDASVLHPASAPGGLDAPSAAGPSDVLDAMLHQLASGARFSGTANRLSPDHHPWELIEVVDRACRRLSVGDAPAALAGPARAVGRTLADAPPLHEAEHSPPPTRAPPGGDADALPPALSPPAGPRAAAIIRQRRSAVSMDRTSRLPRDAFLSLLARTHPALTPWPFAALSAPPRVHLALWVHRVDDLAPGLYLLPRAAEAADALRTRLRDTFTWEHPAEVPDALPLVRLAAGDLRARAASLACGQDIAGDGAFAVAMLADLGGAFATEGAPAYRTLHWEAGLIGQVLYLEAEATGLRATGIGCFFDDATHAELGLLDGRFQTLYHFTVGGPVDDERLTTEPAYPGLG